MEKKKSKERTEFGQRMFDARKKAGLTQKQVCDTLVPPVAQSTLAELERDAAGSRRTAEFAAAYRCNVHWLATGEGEPNFGRESPDRQQPGLPFSELAPFESQVVENFFTVFRRMAATKRHELLSMLNMEGAPAPVARGGVRGMSKLGDLEEEGSPQKRRSR
jgi:transcriptional regulator with XRE-family HTH domain